MAWLGKSLLWGGPGAPVQELSVPTAVAGVVAFVLLPLS